MIIEEFDFFMALYMTVITFSTVGFSEIQPLSEGGRIFTTIYILFNIGIIAYAVSTVSSYLFDGDLKRIYKKYLIHKKVFKMDDHVIVCGFGRNGERACKELKDQNVPFVVIENDESRVERVNDYYGYELLDGDGTDEDVLVEAGIVNAKAIITTLPSDAENVFLTLTARELNPAIKIVSRASEERSEKKLYRAGANKVIMPDAVGGMHMAQHVTNPVVTEYLDMLSGEENLKLEEIPCRDMAPEFIEKSIGELDIRNKTGVTIVGYKEQGQHLVFNPLSSLKLKKEVIIIVLGSNGDLLNFRQKFL